MSSDARVTRCASAATLDGVELRTEIEIEAPPSRVWQVLLDFERYPEWNPFITSITGKAEPGAALDVTLGLADGRQVHESPSINVLEPETELRWTLVRVHRRFLALEHFFLLRPAGEGRTRLVHGANIQGLFVKLAGHTLTLATRASVGMNIALKERVEQGRG